MDDRHPARNLPFPVRGDMPEELLPLYDALAFQLQRIHDEARQIHRMRGWLIFGLGSCTATCLTYVVLIVGRALS